MYYLPKTKKERFTNGIQAIEYFLKNYKSAYNYQIKDKTTNNFKKMQQEVEENNILFVSSEGCENSIYSDKEFNILFRVWHDNIHLQYNLDFSRDQELKVCYLQIEEIDKFLTSEAYSPLLIEDVKEILYHDIAGQVEYYYTNNSFVDDQKLFTYDRFLK